MSPSTMVAVPVVTAGELEVLAMIVDGRTQRQIAARLGITTAAVSMRLARAADALGTLTTAQTAVEAVRRGLLGRDTHRARRLHRELTDRHASTCALLRPPVCDCSATTEVW